MRKKVNDIDYIVETHEDKNTSKQEWIELNCFLISIWIAEYWSNKERFYWQKKRKVWKLQNLISGEYQQVTHICDYVLIKILFSMR